MTLRSILLFVLLIPALLIGSEAQTPESNMVILKNESPLIAFRILFRTGSAADPRGKEGVAALTAALLAEGSTTKNDYEKILKLLFPMAASYSQQVDKEMTVFIGLVHQDYWKPYYQLFKEAILNPAFKTEDFERLKTDQLNSVDKLLRFNDDEELGKEVLNWALYKNHPYGHPEAGMVSSIRNLSLSDVKDFYRQQYTQSNVVLGIAGNAPPELIEAMRMDFATLPQDSSSGSDNKFSPPPKVEGIHAILIEKQTAGTAISFGFPISFTRADEDFYPMMMMNAWFGQHRNQFSHLFKVMRGARGLNYGDYSYIEYFPLGGQTSHPLPNVARHLQAFQVWIRPVQHPNRQFALRQAVRELKMLIDQGITQQDFELTKTFLQNYTVNLAQTVSEQLGYALDDRFYGLSQPFLEKVRSRMSSITREQMNEAIRKHFSSENLTIAIVTQDAENFKKALVENAPSPISYDSPKPQEILNEDKEIMNFPIAIKSENITIIPAEKIFQ